MGNSNWIGSRGNCKEERSYGWRYTKPMRKKKKEIFKFGMGNLYTEELLVDDGERVEFWYNLWLALTVLV